MMGKVRANILDSNGPVYHARNVAHSMQGHILRITECNKIYKKLFNVTK